VRGILSNPKYTGFMVWNRSTNRTGMTVTRKRNPRPGSPDQWVWSSEATHPPLVPLAAWQAAQARLTERAAEHAAAVEQRRTYRLRSRLYHTCGHRMSGDHTNGRTYYRCRNTSAHPHAVCVREDALLPAITAALAERVFGPHRRAFLDQQRQAAPVQQADSTR